MSIFKRCQEFDKLANAFVIVLDNGTFFKGRGKGGIIIYTKNLGEAKVFNDEGSASYVADYVWEFIYKHSSKPRERKPPVVMPFDEAKKIEALAHNL